MSRAAAEEDERKCWVGRLPYDITEDEIRQIFNTYGKVTDVRIHEKGGGKFAFVTYDSKRGAEAACQVLNEVYKFREDSKEPILCSKPRKKGGFESRGQDRDFDRYERESHPRDGHRGRDFDHGSSRRGYDDRGGSRHYSRDRGYDRDRYERPPPRDDRIYRERDRGHDRRDRDDDHYDKGSDGRDGDRPFGGKQAPSPKVYVDNLPTDITKEAMEYVFSNYGRIEDIHIMTNRSKDTSQACAFVRFSTANEARKCIAAMEQGYEIRPGEGDIQVKYADSEGRRGDRNKGRSKGDRSRPY